MSEVLTYSNPRMSAVIEDWPASFTKRVTARFEIETVKGKQRAVRTTDGAPKKLTFAKYARIVDGSDGRTYIAEFNLPYMSVSIMKGDMKLQHEWISAGDPRYSEVLELFADVISEEMRAKLVARGTVR